MKQTQQKGSKRAKLGRYAFFLGSAATLIGRAAADTLASFGFDAYTAGSVGMLSGTLAPDSGTGAASGSHAASATYSFVAGNGSAKSFSSNTWAVGDYYQFQISAPGYMNLAVSFDMARSATGDPGFNLLYSADGTTFSLFTSFSVYAPTTTGTSTFTSGGGGTTTASGVPAFASGSSNSAFNLSFDFSAVTALNNIATDFFRVVANTTPGSTSGTDRIDNFIVTGTAVPEPSTLALFSAAGIGAAIAARRRRKA